MDQEIQFAEDYLHANPCGILVLSTDGRIKWLNRTLEEMLGVSADRLQGHSKDSIPFKTYRGLFEDQGLLHLNGPGVAGERWLQCTVKESTLGGTVSKFFQDVTELVRLREEAGSLQRQVDELTVTDKLTGLGNQRALHGALATQVARSRRYQNPLSLAVIELSDPSDPNARLDDDVVLSTSRFLRDRLRWVDLIARWDHDHFAVILPETGLKEGQELFQDIARGFDQVPLPGAPANRRPLLRFGIAQWSKGDDARLLMDRAAEDLNTRGGIDHTVTAS